MTEERNAVLRDSMLERGEGARQANGHARHRRDFGDQLLVQGTSGLGRYLKPREIPQACPTLARGATTQQDFSAATDHHGRFAPRDGGRFLFGTRNLVLQAQRCVGHKAAAGQRSQAG